MGLFSRLRSELIYLDRLMKTRKLIQDLSPEMTRTAADIIEHWAAETPDQVAIEFEGRSYTYAEYNAAANRYAEWALAQGLGQGDAVALLMENRPDFLFAWCGMAKIGVISALINTNLKDRALAHSLEISQARHLILGAELGENFATARDLMETPITAWAQDGAAEGAEDLNAALAAQPGRPIGKEARPNLRGKDVCFYIYTSGTTGLPKAANFSHMRFFTAMLAWSVAAQATAKDKMFLVLPLYHSAGGVAAPGTVLAVGGTIVLKRKFSVTTFWKDLAASEATLFEYIGELCRYLLNAPPHPDERNHKLRVIVGNGLRPEIWNEFQERFAIPRIVEFYGATEGNVTLFNFDGHPGSIGRVPPYARRTIPVDLVRFDVEKEEPMRGPDGLCLPCAPGEIGEAVGRIDPNVARTRFEGYSNAEATKKKILENVFTPGDSYYRTGDLMRRDAQGYYYFVDRIGDTFRWKGENVATSEVAEAMSVFPGIAEANVYGVHVPNSDGRAGMAAITADGEIDLTGLYSHLAEALPAYARPLFLRMRPQMEITGTFKHRKVELVKEGFDPNVVQDPLYMRDDERQTYVPLSPRLFDDVTSGAMKL